MTRLARFSPEEIAGAVLLLALIIVIAFRPETITDQLRGGPYATPDPSGGPARLLVPEGLP